MTPIFSIVGGRRNKEMTRALARHKRPSVSRRRPQHYKQDPELGLWANTQRCIHKKGDMQPDRIILLNSIDFIWKLDNHEHWMKMFQKLNSNCP